MISAIQWIKKGVAAQHPQRFKVDEKELELMNQFAADRLGEARADLEEAQKAEMEIDSADDSENDSDEEYEESMGDETEEKEASMDHDGEEEAKESSAPRDPNDLSEYNLEDYDKEDESKKKEGPAIFSRPKDLAYYSDEKDDPYITLSNEVDEQEEMEEMQILPDDMLLMAAKTEDDISQLEVYVYEKEADNLYCHHDIMLPSFPLCLEWLDFHTGEKAGQEGSGNYVAVGTFEPDIEIWDLDVVDNMIPQTILGHTDKDKKRSKKVNAKYHVDAVMDLSWNKQHRNFLLSSSADSTVKLWDLSSSTCAQSYTHHNGKVQAVAWNPVEATIFISGSYDKTVCALDARSPQQITKWNLVSDIECLVWDPHHPTNFYAGTEDGVVQYFDVRAAENGVGTKPIFTLQAHDGAVSALDVNPHFPGCIATGSTDNKVKVWNTTDNKPSMVTSRNFELGHIFSAKFSIDTPFDLALAGSNGNIHIWDMSTNAGIRQAYSS